MKKDIEWLKSAIQMNLDFYNDKDEEWQMAKVRAYAKVLDLINQLDEPEVLSQGWIEEHITDGHNVTLGDKVVYADDLENLLVPTLSEMETVEITEEPETVADVIADFFKSLERLKEVMSMEVEELKQ